MERITMIESISAVTLATHNMPHAVRFYRVLGFEIVHGDDNAAFAPCLAHRASKAACEDGEAPPACARRVRNLCYGRSSDPLKQQALPCQNILPQLFSMSGIPTARWSPPITCIIRKSEPNSSGYCSLNSPAGRFHSWI